MTNRLVEYKPTSKLQPFVNSYWFFRNNTGAEICFPVVPDGCSDIIYYLNDSPTLDTVDSTFVSGVMEVAALVPHRNGMELFGIRFCPGVLGILLDTDMKCIKNSLRVLSQINPSVACRLPIDHTTDDTTLVHNVDQLLSTFFLDTPVTNRYLPAIQYLSDNPSVPITEVAQKHHLSLKSMERNFHRLVGLSPKKFARIMRFQNAHKQIQEDGLANLVTVALGSGYFDQAHFNREYKKLVGFNPSNETMSILYNTSDSNPPIV